MRCCSSSHDGFIKGYVLEGLWPDKCKYRDYHGLSELSCLACHPRQPDFTDSKNKVVRICKSLLRQFYFNTKYPDGDGDLDGSTEAFDSCGAWFEPDPILIANDHSDPEKGYTMEIPDPILVFPGGSYANAKEFYADFDQARIPFFEDFAIMAVDDFDEEGNRNVCFAGATSLTSVLPVVLAATVINFLI